MQPRSTLVPLYLYFVSQGIIATDAKSYRHLSPAETPSKPSGRLKTIDIDFLVQRSASLVSPPLSTGRKEPRSPKKNINPEVDHWAEFLYSKPKY